MESKKNSIQCGGLIQIWKMPDENSHHHFLVLDLDCEPSCDPGILIVSDVIHRPLQVKDVENLRKELPGLLETFGPDEIFYWKAEKDKKKRSSIKSGLTDHPEFVG